MRKLVYSPDYRVRMIELKKYLDERFGEASEKKVMKAITNRIHMLCIYEESGVSIRALYGIDTDYRFVYVAHQYIFYRVDAKAVYVVNMYHEREDFMQKLFGIRTTSQDTDDYWGE